MFFVRQGQVAEKPHLRLPEGSYEEEHGLDGFFGPVSHLYHRHPPTAWSSIERASFQWSPLELQDEGFLRPRCFRKEEAAKTELNFFESGQCYFWNEDCRVWQHSIGKTSALYFRNADASELYFCHRGDFVLQSVYGELAIAQGDYLLVPKGCSYRFEVKKAGLLLRIESLKSAFQRPDTGLMGQHALYSAQDLVPVEWKEKIQSESSSRVWVQKSFQLTEIQYAHDIRESFGWMGNLFPLKLPISKIAPAMSPTAHLPPSINSTFVTPEFVVCSFVPRPLEEATGALKVPFFHSNIDYDEVIFYHDGDFFSRDKMEAGCMTLHPRGIHHGPHPKALQNQSKATRTEEIAVMLDTRKELHATAHAKAQEIDDYWRSWQGGALK